MSEFTKKAIKETFLSLLEKKPLSQITVKSIAEECGINRNSFYYHYNDIPDLLGEIVKDIVENLLTEYSDKDSLSEILHRSADFVIENRRSIMHIYNSVNRAIFESEMWRICDYIVSTYDKTFRNSLQLDSKDREIVNMIYKCEFFGMLMLWLDEGLSEGIHEKINRICALLKNLSEDLLLLDINKKAPR